jgi:hypothetical protein
VGRQQFRPAGHHPASGNRGGALPAKGVVDLPPVGRGESPVPDAGDGDPLRGARRQDPLFVLGARADGTRHGVYPIEEPLELGRPADVGHRPAAPGRERLREPLRVPDDVVHQEDLPDLGPGGELRGGPPTNAAPKGDLHTTHSNRGLARISPTFLLRWRIEHVYCVALLRSRRSFNYACVAQIRGALYPRPATPLSVRNAVKCGPVLLRVGLFRRFRVDIAGRVLLI